MRSPAESRSGLRPPTACPDQAGGQSLPARFASLVQRTEAEVFRSIFRHVGNEAVAFDLTQETFLRAWEAYGRLDSAQDGRTWVLAIARNVVVSHHRSATSQKRGGGRTISLEQLNPEMDGEGRAEPPAALIDGSSEQPIDALIRAESLEAIDRAAEGLKEKYRSLYRRYREGQSTAEIAEATGRTVAAVASDHTRLIRMLRSRLRPP
jgi:RNA polymerase sigma-70 factor (ECF subfamily)